MSRFRSMMASGENRVEFRTTKEIEDIYITKFYIPIGLPVQLQSGTLAIGAYKSDGTELRDKPFKRGDLTLVNLGNMSFKLGISGDQNYQITLNVDGYNYKYYRLKLGYNYEMIDSKCYPLSDFYYYCFNINEYNIDGIQIAYTKLNSGFGSTVNLVSGQSYSQAYPLYYVEYTG